MVLTEEEIKELQKLCKDKFGEEISKEDAIEQGINLMRLVEAVYEPKIL